MALATLSIDLVARLASLERDMGVAVRVVEKSSSSIVGSLGAIGNAVKVVVGGAFVAGMASLVSSNVNAVDSFNDLKDATGASIENISALDGVARRTGTTYEDMSTILVKFNKALNEAKPDNDAGRVFQAMGLDVAKLKAMDPAEALRTVAVAMQGFARDGDLARATQVLFSKSVQQAAPFLKDLAEAGQLNATVTTEQAEKAEAFNKQLYQLKANSEDLKRELVMGLIPAMNSLLETYNKEGFLALFGFNKEFKQKGELAGMASEVIQLDAALKKLKSDKEGGLATYIFGDSRFFGDPAKLDQEIASVTAKLEAAKARFRGADAKSRYVPFEAGFIPQDPSAKLKVGGVPDTKLQSMIEQGRKLAESMSLVESGFSADFIEKMKQLNAAYASGAIKIDGYSDSIDRLIKQQPFMKRDLFLGDTSSDALSRRLASLESTRKAAEELNSELDKLADGGNTRKRDLTNQLEARLNAGEIIDPATLDRIVRGIGGVNQELAQTRDIAGDFASVFESGFEKAILSGEKLSDVLKALGKDLLQVALRTAITQPLGQMAGNFMAGIFGSMFGGLFGGARAEGGPVSSGSTYLVGENGPELFTPRGNGQIVPNGKMGGGVTVINHWTVGDVASMSMVQRAIAMSESRTAGRLGRSRQYGGAFA